MERRDFSEHAELIRLLHRIHTKLGLSAIDFFAEIQLSKYVPVSIFSKTLSPLETVVKYLRENQKYTLVKISKLLNRSDKTIWQAYSSSKRKHKKVFKITDINYLIPISILNDRKYTVFELIVLFLVQEYELRFCDVAKILDRDQRTIWTVHNRALKKNEK